MVVDGVVAPSTPAKKEKVITNMGYIKFWSDSFLRCFIKQQHNSTWIANTLSDGRPPVDGPQQTAGSYRH
jgi:hypothetical protein